MMDASIAPSPSWSITLPKLDRIIRGLLLVYVFALPFKGLLVIERTGFLLLLVLMGIWCAVQRRLFFLRTPLDLPLLAFLAWVGLTIPFAAYPLYSLQEYGKLLQQVLVFYAVLFFFKEKEEWSKLVWLLAGTSFLISLYGVMQFEPTDLLPVTSFLSAEVWLTTYLIMMLPLSIALAWHEQRPWAKGLSIAGAAFITICLLLTQSRAGLIAFVVELWAFAWLLRRRAMVYAAAAVTVLLGVTLLLLVKVTTTSGGEITIVARVPVPIKTSLVSFVHRLDIWAFSLEQVAEHPLVGIGYGKETSKMLFGQVPETNLPPGHSPVRTHGAHNILLELALLVGVPGMLLFVWLAASILQVIVGGFRRVTDTFSKATLVGIGVGAIGLAVRIQFDQMLVGTLAIQFWVMTAVAVLACGAAAVAAEQPTGGTQQRVSESGVWPALGLHRR